MFRTTTFAFAAAALALAVNVSAADAGNVNSKAAAVMFNPQPDPPHFSVAPQLVRPGTGLAAKGIVPMDGGKAGIPIGGVKVLLPAVQHPAAKPPTIKVPTTTFRVR